jgi:diguanylate cyclase (GGDEF)-like protein
MGVTYELNAVRESDPGATRGGPRETAGAASEVPLGATVELSLVGPTTRPTLTGFSHDSRLPGWLGHFRAWGRRRFAPRRAETPWATFLARLPEAQGIEQLRALLTDTAGAILPGCRIEIDLPGMEDSRTALAHPLVLPLAAWEHPVGTVRIEPRPGRELSRSDRDRLEEFSRVAALLLLGAAAARPGTGTGAGSGAVTSPRGRGTGVDPRDPVTGLPRVASLEAFIDQARRDRTADRQALILVLPDRLSAFREEAGDPLADAGLTLVARAVRGTLRSSDRVVRLAGDRIAAMLPGIRKADALRVAETVRGAIAEAGVTSSTPWPLTASIGVVTCPDDADDATGLRLAAHRAVARAAAKGGNHVAGLGGTPVTKN